jgi:hypothetical protein
MSYNQFTTVEFTEDGKGLTINGTTDDASTLERIDVAIAPAPPDGEFPDLLADCSFQLAQPATIKGDWHASYELASPDEFKPRDRVLVVGRATYTEGIDLWAETVRTIAFGDKPPAETHP